MDSIKITKVLKSRQGRKKSQKKRCDDGRSQHTIPGFDDGERGLWTKGCW